MIRVLIVHETLLVCNALANVLQEEADMQVAGICASTEEALEQVEDSEIDLLLFNVSRPSKETLAFIQKVANTQPATKMVAMGMAEMPEFILQCFQAGATGYSLQTDSLAELIRKIRSAYSGKPLLSPQIAGALVSRIAELSQLVGRTEPRDNDLSLLSAELTPREREVLCYLERGCSNQEIAESLTIEVGTVKNHVHSILKKLNVDNRKRAAILARQVMAEDTVWHIEPAHVYGTPAFAQ